MPRMEEVPDPLHHFHTLRSFATIIKERFIHYFAFTHPSYVSNPYEQITKNENSFISDTRL
jgi:hypothetical protein